MAASTVGPLPLKERWIRLLAIPNAKNGLFQLGGIRDAYLLSFGHGGQSCYFLIRRVARGSELHDTH
jgi:hypothetical protein